MDVGKDSEGRNRGEGKQPLDFTGTIAYFKTLVKGEEIKWIKGNLEYWAVM